MKNTTDIIVIGGGASGLMAAITALKEGLQVLVLEAAEKPGKKLLATGNGRCNFTHSGIISADYHGEKRDFIDALLSAYTTERIVSLFTEMGMLCREKEGYYYPASESSATVLQTLLLAFYDLGGKLYTEQEVMEITKEDELFGVKTKDKVFFSKKIICAAGTKAGGFLKKSDAGMPYHIFDKYDIGVTKLFPSLTRCICKEGFYNKLAGLRVKSLVKLMVDSTILGEEEGEVQFTKNGVSGIVIFNFSAQVGELLAQGKKPYFTIDLLPLLEVDGKEEGFVCDRRGRMQGRDTYSFFQGLMHEKLIRELLHICDLKSDEPICRYTDAELGQVLYVAKHFRTFVLKTDTVESAQCIRGGISLAEVSDRLELYKLPGCYICGEILDVDGPCGGYNLHFAWASGHKAARSCVADCRKG